VDQVQKLVAPVVLLEGVSSFPLLNRGPHFFYPGVTVTLALLSYVPFVSHTHKVIYSAKVHTISSLSLSHSLRTPTSTDCYLVYVLSLFGQCQSVYIKCELGWDTIRYAEGIHPIRIER